MQKLREKALKHRRTNDSLKYINNHFIELFGVKTMVEVYTQISTINYMFDPDIQRVETIEVYEWDYKERSMLSVTCIDTMMMGKSCNLYGYYKGTSESRYTDSGKELSHCDVTHHNVYKTSINASYVCSYSTAEYINTASTERTYYEI